MANKAFNSIDGFSVGQPANGVIDGGSNANLANANIVGNANLSGNLNATGSANFAGNVSISNIANFSIPGGLAGQGIGTDGAGNLTWYTFSGGGGGGNPAPPANSVQFNDAGSFGGASSFTYNNVTSTLNLYAANLTGNIRAASANLGNLVSANYVNVAANVITSNLRILTDLNAITGNFYGNVNVQANLTANSFIGNGYYLTAVTAARLANSLSNVDIPSVNGPITMTSNGYANIFVAASSGVVVRPSLTLSTSNTAYTKTIVSGNGNPTLVLSDVTNLAKGMVLSGAPFNTTPRPIITSVNTGANSVTISSPPTAGALTSVTFTSYPVGNLNVNTINGNLGFRVTSGTYIDNIAVVNGTVANSAVHALAIPTIGASNSNVTFSNATTFYIQGPPITIGPANITNAYSLYVNSGTSRFRNEVEVGGNINVEASLNTASANITGANIVTLDVTSQSNLGDIANVIITGGLPGYTIQTDGAGTLVWGPGGGGSGGTPAGGNQAVQYNDQGNFGASGTFTFDSTSEILSVPSLNVANGNITANTLSILAGTQNAAFSIGNSNIVIGNNGPVTISTSGIPNVMSISTTNVTANATFSTTGSLIYQGQTQLVNAGSFNTGSAYQIIVIGDTDWAAAAGTNNIAAGSFNISDPYVVATVGDTDWVSIGATASAVVDGEITDGNNGQFVGEISDVAASPIINFLGDISDGSGGIGQILNVTTSPSPSPIISGMTIAGFGVSAATQITGQLTGTPGGIGTYSVDISQIVTSTTIQGATAGTNLYVSSVITSGMTIAAGTEISGVGVVPNTTIIAQIDGSPSGIGNYTVDTSQVVFSSTIDAISIGNVLTVTNVTSGALQVGTTLTGTNIVPGTTITALGSGTGGIGNYTVSTSQLAPFDTITGQPLIGANFVATGLGSGTGIADQYYIVGNSFIAVNAGSGTGETVLNGAQDRGAILSYWESNLGFPTNAFMGWNQANLEFLVANQVTVSDGVITQYTQGNIRANYFIGNFTGNIYGPIAGPGQNTQIIYQNDQFIEGAVGFTYDDTTNSVFIANVLTVDGNILGNGNINANGYLSVGADANIGGNITIAGNIDGLGNIYSQFDASIGGNANIGNNLSLLGNIVTPGNISGGSITAAGDVSVTGNITVDNLTLTGNFTTLGDIIGLNGTFNNDLNVLHDATVSGNLDVTGNVNISGDVTLPLGNISANGMTTDGNNFTVDVVRNVTLIGQNASIQTTRTDISGYANVGSFMNVASYLQVGGVIYSNTGIQARNLSTISTGGLISAGNLTVGANGSIPNLTATLSTLSNSQPNITSVGTLTDLGVSGNISVGNLLAPNILLANTGEITLMGNVVGQVDGTPTGPTYYIGNGVYLSGITFTGSTGGRIENGGSNVSIFGPSTNIEMAVDLVNVVSISSSAMTLTGFPGTMDLIVSGNISAPSFANGTSNLIIRNSSDVTISANGVANVIKATSNSVSLIGNTDITGNILSTTGNFTAGGYANIGSNLTVSGNANIFANARIGGSANIVGNLVVQSKTDITDNLTVGAFSAPGIPTLGSNANISGNAIIGGNLTVGWSTGLPPTGQTGRSDITVFGNVEGLRDGDPRGTTFYFGNAAFLEGIPPAPAGSYISNGSSNVYIVGPNANITMSANTVNLVTVFANVNSSTGAVNSSGMILGAQRDAGPGGIPAAYTGPANLSLINNSSIYFTGLGNVELDTGYFVGPHANIQTLFANAGNILTLTSTGITISDINPYGSGYLSVQGNATIGRNLTVSGSFANIDARLNVTGGGNIQAGGLRVYGDLTLPYDDITASNGRVTSNNATINNNITILGNATVGNYITVDATPAASALGLAGIRGNLGRGNTYITTPTSSGNMYFYIGNTANVAENGTLAITLSAPSIPQASTIASNAEYGTNVFTVGNSQVFNLDDPIQFTGSVFGNVTLGNIYYVKSQPSTTELTISATLRGPTFSIELADTATATDSVTNEITVTDGLKFPTGSGVIFTGTVFGNVAADTTYYVVNNSLTSIQIAEDPQSTFPSVLQLTTATGSMTVTNAIAVDISLSTVATPPDDDYFTVSSGEYLDAYDIGDAVQFSGTLFGGVSSGVTYYIVGLTSVFITNVTPYTNLSISTTPTGSAMTLTTGSGSMTMTRIGQGGAMTVLRQSNLDTSMLLQGKLDVTGYANLLGGVGLAGNVDVTGNLNVVDDLNVGGAITATSLNITSDLIIPGNITGGNLLTPNNVIATGNIDGANGNFTGSVTVGSSLNVIGNVEATSGDFANLGNAVQGNYFVGNGFYLTGVVSSGPPYSRLENGSSNIAILFANGNATITVGGIANVLNVTTVGANLKGIANITGNLISGGNANVRYNANIGGNILIGGNANITGNTLIGNNLAVTGNLSAANADLGYQANAQFFVGNGFYLTGIQASAGTSMVNGSSNVVTRYSGNTTLSVGGVPNVFLVANNGVFVTGNITGSANANIGGNLNLTGNASLLGNVTIASSKSLSVSTIANTFSVSNGTSNLRIASSGAVSISTGGIANIATFGIAATTLTGNLNVLQNMAVTGNLSASNINGVQNFTLTGNMQTGNLTVLSDSTFGGTVTINGLFNVVGDTAITGNLSVSKNQVIVGNLTTSLNAIIGGEARVSGNANITGNTNVTASLLVGASANIVAGLRVGTTANIVGNANVGGNLVVTNNANVGAELRVTGNANVTTNVNVTGNVTASYYFGNGSQLSGIQASGGTANNIANGTSNVNIPTINGNITMGVGGVANVLVVSTVGANVANLVVTGNSNLNNISNVKIAGGTSGQVVQTDGSGNLSFVSVSTSGVSNGTSNLSIPLIDGNVNISANGNANVFVVSGTGITVTGNSNLGAIGNVKITGGTANQFLQTDGAGNLSFSTLSSASISNGNSSVSIPVIDGNVDIIANGNTTLVVTSTGANVTGTIGATSNITAGNGSAATYFDINAINTSYAATRVIRSGSERWLIGADASSANGNAVIRYNATINYVTVAESGLVTLSNNLIVTGNANVANLNTTGNVNSGNANLGNLVLANYVNVLANITSGNANLGNIALANYVNVSSNLTAGNANLGNLAEANFVNVTSNLTSGNANLGNLALANYVNVLANITSGNANLGNLLTANFANISVNLEVTGNITSGNANLGNLVTANYVNVSSNITSGNANLGNLAAANYINVANDISIIGNITSGNANLGNLALANYVNVANDANIVGNITAGNANLGNLVTANYFTINGSTGNLTLSGGNIDGANVINANTIEILANANVGNLSFGTGQITGTGNITAGYYFGNGSQLTGINASGGTANILSNGNSNVNIPVANGNITFSAVGNSNVVVITGTGINVAGTSNVVGNLSTGNADLGNLLVANFANISNNLAVVGNITSGNANLGNLVTANYVNVSSNVTAGNADLGNVVTANFVNVSSNLTAGNANLGNLALANFVNVSSNLTASNANVSNLFADLANISNIEVTNNANINNLTANNAVITTGNITTINSGLMQFGNSNIAITSNANITFTSNSNATFVVTSTGANVIGNLEVSSNANVGNLSATQVFATANVTAPVLVSNIATGTAPIQVISTTQIANMNVQTAGSLVNGTSNINIPAVNGNINFVSAGNTTLSVSDTGANLAGNLNVVGNIANANNISVTNNISVGSANITNLLQGANANFTSNVNAVNFIGNLANGASNVQIDSGGNIRFSPGTGHANAVIFSSGGVDIIGYIAANGNITSNTGFVSNTVTAFANTPLTLNAGTATGAANINVVLVPTGNGTVDVSSKRITNVAEPTSDQDAATKYYVDQVAQGLNIHTAALAATTNTLTILTGGTITYNNGTSGVGANLVLTGSPTANFLSANVFDGNVTAVVTSRILVKNETNQAYNGVYVVDSATVMTRALDFNSVPEIEPGDFIFVQDGTTYNDSGWVQTAVVVIVGTDPIVFTQFSGAGSYTANTSAGLLLTGSVFSAKVDGNVNPTTAFDGQGNIYVPANAAFTTPNIGAATGTSVNLSGNVLAGNINSNAMITTSNIEVSANILTNNLTANVNITATGNLAGNNANITNLLEVGGNANISLTLNGNVANFSGNLTALNANLGNLAIANYVNVATQLNGNVANFSGNLTAANANLGNLVLANYVNVSSNITSGNANLGNLLLANFGNFSSNITSGNANLGNLLLANFGNFASNVTAGNANLGNLVSANYGNFANNLNVIGNANVGNLSFSTGQINGTGNITAGYFFGNGSQLTGISTSSNTIFNGNSNVSIPSANGNINLSAAGNANVVVITGTGMNVEGNISGANVINANTGNFSANVTAAFFLGNGSQLTGVSTSSNTIFNGNSNVSIPSANGNVTISAVGVSNVLVITGTGVNVAGTLNANGNANLGNLGASGLITATGNVSGGNLTTGGALDVIGNANVGNLGTAGLITATGNITGGNISTGGSLSVTGNANVGNIGISGGVSISGNANVGNLGVSGLATITGNITGGNISTGGVLSVTGNANVGNLGTAGLITATGNVSGGNLTTAGRLSVTGNANVGNVGALAGVFTGNVSVNNLSISRFVSTSLIPAANVTYNLGNSTNRWKDLWLSNATLYFDDFQTVSAGTLTSGNSNVTIPIVDGNINLTANSNTTIVVTETGANITGYANITGNVIVGNLDSAGIISATGNISGGNLSTSGALSVTGNANIGNLGITGLLAITGNLSAGNLSTGGRLSVTGNANVGNIGAAIGLFTGNISAANATLGNLASANFISGDGYLLTNLTIPTSTTIVNGNSNVSIPVANGNINLSSAGNANIVVITGTGMNVAGTANVSGNANVGNLDASGNVTATFFIGNGSQLTGIATGSTSNISNGNSNVNIPSANGNVNISAVGNANVIVITGTGMNVAGTANVSGNANVGNLGASGNVSATFFIGNGSQLTGISASSNTIFNGNSNVNIPSANGNVNISAVGNANVVVVTGTGMNVAGTANITGNIITGSGTGGNISGANVISANSGNFATTLNVVGNANVGNLGFGSGIITGTGNVTAGYFLGNGSQLTGISTSSNTIFNGNSNVSIPTANGNINLSAVGNANVVVVTGTGMNVAGTANITGNIITGSGTGGNISGANVISANTGNFTANVTASYFLGNGSQLTGISLANISNGNSNVNVPAANGNVNISAVGNANVVVITGTGMNVAGYANITGNITGANVISANSATLSTTLSVTGNANVGNLGTSGLITATGNVSGGNLTTIGQIVSNRAGNLSDGGGQLYLNGTGNNRIDFNASGIGAPTTTTRSAGTKINLYPNQGATTVDYAIGVDAGTLWNSVPALDAGQYFKWYGGNTQVASLSGTGVFSATGNVSGGNLTTSGALSVTGNANVGNLGASGNVSATFFIGNGSQLTGISGGGGGSNISNGNSNVSIATANGNITMSAIGNSNVMVITGTGANINGTANITGNVALSGANVTLGAVSNLHITGGTSGYLLTTDGSGTLSWSTPSSTVVTVDSFTGNGVQTQYTLSVTPTSVNYVFLAIGGVSQPRSTYSLAGDVVTVSSAPANTAAVEFTSITGVSGGGSGGASSARALGYSLIFGG